MDGATHRWSRSQNMRFEVARGHFANVGTGTSVRFALALIPVAIQNPDDEVTPSAAKRLADFADDVRRMRLRLDVSLSHGDSRWEHSFLRADTGIKVRNRIRWSDG